VRLDRNEPVVPVCGKGTDLPCPVDLAISDVLCRTVRVATRIFEMHVTDQITDGMIASGKRLVARTVCVPGIPVDSERWVSDGPHQVGRAFTSVAPEPLLVLDSELNTHRSGALGSTRENL
jgi:hypothetical protein